MVATNYKKSESEDPHSFSSLNKSGKKEKDN